MTISRFFSVAVFFSLISSTAHALPIINILQDQVSVNAQVVLEDAFGNFTSFEDSYTSSLLSGSHSVNALSDRYYRAYAGDTGYEALAIDANALLTVGVGTHSTSFYFETESDVYGVDEESSPPADKIITSVNSIEATISVYWDFYVTGGDALFDGLVHDEVTGGSLPLPGHTSSVDTISLYDLTTSSMILELIGGYASESAVLLDGHRYILTTMTGDYGPSDEDVCSQFSFHDSQLVYTSVPEPSAFLLLCLGLLPLGVVNLFRKNPNGRVVVME